jgi:D-alanyl-D-alanine carboxypeptidase
MAGVDRCVMEPEPRAPYTARRERDVYRRWERRCRTPSAARKARDVTSMEAARARARAFLAMVFVIGLALSSATVHSVAASSIFAIDPPKVTAKAIYAIDVTGDVELLADHADDRRPPASTTKIASAIVVVDNIPDLNQSVTIEEADVAPLASDESRMGLEVGDVLTVRQLLDGMLVQSGSDATYAAARVTGNLLIAAGAGERDPVAAFIAAMNRLAASMKLKNTHFANPVGIDEDDHFSSARDLARLAQEALARPVIAEIVAQQSVQTTIDGPNRREVTLENTNELLDGESITGVKTGSTTGAGACLVLAKRENGTNQVITVVLGSTLSYDNEGFIAEDLRWDDAKAVLSAIEREVRWVAPDDPEEVPGLRDELAAWQVVLKHPASIVVPADRLRSLRYVLQLGPAGKPNARVGHVVFFVGSEKIAEVPVFQAPVS